MQKKKKIEINCGNIKSADIFRRCKYFMSKNVKDTVSPLAITRYILPANTCVKWLKKIKVSFYGVH